MMLDRSDKISLAVALSLAVIGLLILATTLPKSFKAAPVGKTVAAAVSTVSKQSTTEATQSTKAKEAIKHVKKTTAATDDMGDTGRAGLAGLCQLRPYSEDAKVCKLLRDDPAGVEEARGSGIPARQ